MVLLATFCALRVGELRALRQVNLDLLHRTVSVVEQYQQLADGTLVLGPPKTDAGARTVSIPTVLIPDLEAHLATWAEPGPQNLVFPGETGRPFRTATLARGVAPRAPRGRDHWLAVPRPPPHREHPRGVHRSEHEGVDVQDGTRLRPRRADLPARDPRPRCGDRRPPQHPCRGAPAPRPVGAHRPQLLAQRATPGIDGVDRSRYRMLPRAPAAVGSGDASSGWYRPQLPGTRKPVGWRAGRVSSEEVDVVAEISGLIDVGRGGRTHARLRCPDGVGDAGRPGVSGFAVAAARGQGRRVRSWWWVTSTIGWVSCWSGVGCCRGRSR